MERIWGSCTIEERAIRLSNRLDDAPRYALDYILLHELVHLLVAGHGSDFKALLSVYPQLERAEGYLEGRQIRLDEDLIDFKESAGRVAPEISAGVPVEVEDVVEISAEVATGVDEADDQAALSPIKRSRSSVPAQTRTKGEGQLELISLGEISA